MLWISRVTGRASARGGIGFVIMSNEVGFLRQAGKGQPSICGEIRYFAALVMDFFFELIDEYPGWHLALRHALVQWYFFAVEKIVRR